MANQKKKIIQDVIPPKRSIRNVELSSRAKRTKYEDNPIIIRSEMPKEEVPEKTTEKTPEIKQKEPPSTVDMLKKVSSKPSYRVGGNYKPEPVKTTSPSSSSYKYEYDNPRKGSRKILYSVITILILAGGFGFSAFFKSAEIRVTPKNETRNFIQSFTTKKDTTRSNLGFQVVTVSKDMDKTVEATTEQKIERKATGKIIVYNNFSPAAQKLIATTRFQTSEGLIFHTPIAIIIPGRQVKNGKTIAGSLEVMVEADKTGDTYNVGLKDFTLPGFKGTAKYSGIYAKSKTIMSGGFSGVQKVVSKELMTEADAELTSSLKSALSNEIVSQIPSNFVLYGNSMSYDFEPTAQTSGGVADSKSSAILRKKGTGSAIIFDKGSLSRTILGKIAPDIVDNVVNITNLESLNFTYASSTHFDPNTSTSISFSLSGIANLVWAFDENKLKSDLLGLSKTNAKTVISTYSAIKEAWIETRPFWNQTIPSNSAKVTFVNTLSSTE